MKSFALSGPLFILALVLTLVFGTQGARAANPQFSGLNQGDVDNVNREFTANSSWHSATTPSSLGTLWGFELGVVGGITKTPEINNLANRAQPGTDAGLIPHGGLLGGLTVPFGFTAEALFIPRVNVSGVDFQQYGGAIKWTLTDTVLPLPAVSIAVRGFAAKSQLAFNQNVTDANSGLSVPTKVTQSSQVSGVQVFASPKLIPVIEPYLGFGYVQGKGSLSADVVNNSLLTSGTSPDSSFTTSQFLVGIEAKLLFVALGVEYERSFGTEMYTGKLSFKF